MNSFRPIFLVFALLATPCLGRETVDLSKHPARQLSFWQEYRKASLSKRVFEAPPLLIEYLNLDNQLNGYPEKPQRTSLDKILTQDIQRAIEGLPKSIQSLVDPHLLGIFIVKDLGGSAYTDYSYDRDGKPNATYIIIDADALNKKANDWITWKENTPFTPDDSAMVLTAKIETEAGNTRINALQYIILHELGHVVGHALSIHPKWGQKELKQEQLELYPFSKLSWIKDQDTFQRMHEKEHPAPGLLLYYFSSDKKPKSRDMTSYYNWLATTDYPTLYAATNMFDDFAETFASYVHTIIMKKPYEITLSQRGKMTKTITACWSEKRCQAKRQFLEAKLSL